MVAGRRARRRLDTGGSLRRAREGERIDVAVADPLRDQLGLGLADQRAFVHAQHRDADVEALTHGHLTSLALQTRHELFDERVSFTGPAYRAPATQTPSG